ncbi:MAG TPA: hypothetical protein VMW29_03355 [Candidatus Bathyarchaeia archaeon]|nr:hypothetical protein [Candidatus Bathyarchaeia archaeon]
MQSPIVYWRERKKEYRFLDRVGKLVSFTKIFNPPAGFEPWPYYSAIAEFRNGLKKTGQLVLEGKKPKIGGKVLGVIRRIGLQDKSGIINYGIKFKLL